MNFAERALTFESDGADLVGVVAEPEVPADVAVLVIVGGPQYRAGSHRQFVLLARRLAAAGFPVMRFDYRGMGDAGGDPRNFDESGPDIAAAIGRLLGESTVARRVVLWGLCDAASAALIYWHASRDERVAGMVLLNPWVRSEASLAKTHIKHYYGKRLLEREFWSKLARGRLNPASALRGLAGAVARSSRAGKGNAPGAPERYQDSMALGLEAFPGPVLLILSGRDLTAKEFLEFSRADTTWREALARANVSRHDLAMADHTFSSLAWSTEVEDATLRWLAAEVVAIQK
jgi:exosortase A-associated hydrolase 1